MSFLRRAFKNYKSMKQKMDVEWRECSSDLAFILLLESLINLFKLFYLNKMGKGCCLSSESSGECGRGYFLFSSSHEVNSIVE